MNKLTFYIVDVFAEKKYAGNQLAVFRHAEQLSSEEMQHIAREINFSETTFILNDEKVENGFDVRIFTPKEEIPFAGHPTLGTAHIIRQYIAQPIDNKIILNLKTGQIPVTFEESGYAWMKQNPPIFSHQYPHELFAEILGLNIEELDCNFPIQEVSTGLPFFIVPLKNLAALKKAKTNQEKYFKLIETTQAKAILVFSPETYEPQHDVSVRVFLDYYGVSEDPATGSGNGCLAGYLVKYRYFRSKNIYLGSEQGYEINRPSLLLLKSAQLDNKEIDVFVGGKSIIIASGEFY